MSECTLQEILFAYRPPKPKSRIFVIAREGSEQAKVGDRIRGWAEITDAFVPDSIEFTHG